MYFTGDDGFQNIFLYQPRFSTLQLKKIIKAYLTIFLVGNQKEYIALFFLLNILLLLFFLFA